MDGVRPVGAGSGYMIRIPFSVARMTGPWPRGRDLSQMTQKITKILGQVVRPPSCAPERSSGRGAWSAQPAIPLYRVEQTDYSAACGSRHSLMKASNVSMSNPSNAAACAGTSSHSAIAVISGS